MKMEHYKISKLLNYASLSKFVTKKRFEVNDLSSGQYSDSENKRFKTSILRSDLCDYSDAHIVVKGRISVIDYNANNPEKKLIFKNNAPFRSCMLKINNTFIDNTEDLDFVMPMYNLLEYNDNYFMASGSLWNYRRDEVNENANKNNANNYRINNNKIITSIYFMYKTKIIESMSNDNNTLDAEVIVSLKYFSIFWRSLDLPLITCEIELNLKRTKTCVITEICKTPELLANPNANSPNHLNQATATTGATFQINNAKLYVSVVTLSINDNIKILENVKQGFKRIISWKKIRSEITKQPKRF